MPEPVALPLGMAPAPRVGTPILKPVDLGVYAPEYAGWCVVIRPEIPLGAQELAADLGDTSLSMRERTRALFAWLEAVCLYWNFTRYDPTTDTDVAIPQPDAGGARHLPSDLIGPLAKAVADAMLPKVSGGASTAP